MFGHIIASGKPNAKEFAFRTIDPVVKEKGCLYEHKDI